jgi:hypothetical protein
MCARRVTGPPMPSDPDREAPDPAAYCLSSPGAVVDAASWQRDDSGEVDIEDNWQQNRPHDESGDDND